ncbi:hypothetical protein FOMPIDRAFT_85688 [Fomitopsis schrenkii]|uniref:Uncharacterized protein n=1 Tax=Fomitopsis schrenkii TaxID=2126942 RepID=S8E5B5_FOMSC|nr:hypothetical protein FOMPIDRAFT_85688 [Fomitopsis schrenkii]
MFPTLKAFGVGAIRWSTLGGSVHTRPLSAQTKHGETDACDSRTLEVLPDLSRPTYSCFQPYKAWAGTPDIVNWFAPAVAPVLVAQTNPSPRSVSKKKGASTAQITIASSMSKVGGLPYFTGH